MLDIIPIMVITFYIFDTFEYLHLILVLELECSFFSSSDVWNEKKMIPITFFFHNNDSCDGDGIVGVDGNDADDSITIKWRWWGQW